MQAHFSSFTAEAMRAFGQELAAGRERRHEFLDHTKQKTCALLAEFRRTHQEAESQRRQQAEREADARRLFMSELRSGGHALRTRFELARREMAADLQQMASELHAASEAFRCRPGHAAARPERPDQDFAPRPSDESQESGKRPAHSKRRHG